MKQTYIALKVFAWGLICLMLAFILFLTSGCATQHNFDKYIDRAVEREDTPRLAHIAAKFNWLFPITESKDAEYIYLPGKPVPGPVQFVTVDCDSAVQASLDNASKDRQDNRVIVRVPVYSTKQVDTAKIIETITKKSSAEVVIAQGRANALQTQNTALQAELNLSNKERDSYKAEKRTWRDRALWTWAIIAALLVIRLYLWYQKRKVRLAGKLL